jgi:RNA polymerase sigma-70 factor (ECF subfamily)
MSDSQTMPLPLTPRRLSAEEADALFHALLAERQQEILAMVCGITHDLHAAQDITQETFIELHHFLLHKKVDSRLVGWLRKAAINRSLKLLRARKKRPPTVSLDEAPEAAAVAIQPTIEKSEHCQRLVLALSRLSDRQREVFEMRAMDDLSFEDIATRLRMNTATARSTYQRVYLHLRAVEGLEKPLQKK